MLSWDGTWQKPKPELVGCVEILEMAMRELEWLFPYAPFSCPEGKHELRLPCSPTTNS